MMDDVVLKMLASGKAVLAYPGCPDAWRLKPEDIQSATSSKVRVCEVLDNAGYLYPSREYVVVKQKDESVLLEDQHGSRRWVHQSFLRNLDGSRFEPKLEAV